MDPEIRTFVAELFNSTLKCACFAYNGQDADSCSAADVRNAASEKNRFDSAEAETSQARRALELSLSDTSMDLNWSPNDFSVEDLVIHMSQKDLSTVRLLSEKTKEVAEAAYADMCHILLNPTTVGHNVLVAEFEKMSSQGQKQEKSFHDQFPLQQSKNYIMGSPHGTTILWYQRATQIIVGCDSQSTITWKPNEDSVNKRPYEFVASLSEEKFVDIIEGVERVHATLCGDGKRCEAMLSHVKRKMFAKRYTTGHQGTLEDVCQAATQYFRELKPMEPEHKISTVFICGWKSDLNKYEVYMVGDKYEQPQLILDTVFGSGSGHGEVLNQLECLESPINADMMKDKMIRADLGDPYTGGVLKVISLKDGNCKTELYKGHMIDELHDSVYANILFDEKSMFVIIYLRDAEHLSTGDLVKHLQRFDKNISNNQIHWLCFPGKQFCVYRVILSSPECCQTWFNSCEVLKEPVRHQMCSNEVGVSCQYYVTYARSEILARARSMKTFYDLADR